MRSKFDAYSQTLAQTRLFDDLAQRGDILLDAGLCFATHPREFRRDPLRPVPFAIRSPTLVGPPFALMIGLNDRAHLGPSGGDRHNGCR